MWICLGIAAAIIVIILVATGTLLIPGVVPLLIALWLINRKANRLGKELGITRASIKQALARAKLAGPRSPPVGAPPAPVARPAPASPQPAASPQAAAHGRRRTSGFPPVACGLFKPAPQPAASSSNSPGTGWPRRFREKRPSASPPAPT